MSAPDLLRKERFGALYYRRPSRTFYAVPPLLALLLDEARERSILEAYASRLHPFGPDEPSFVRTVARWRRLGILDRDDRCRARVVEGSLDHRGLLGPMVAHVQLTRACNLRCEHCFVGVDARPAPGELAAAELRDLFRQLGELGTPIAVLSGGEPLLRHDLDQLLAGLEPAAIDAWLCTNGTLIDGALAERLAASPLAGVNVSLDGAEPAAHDALRGAGSFAQARRGIALLTAAGVREVKLRVTVSSANADSLLAFAPLARELGVQRVVFKPFQAVGAAARTQHLLLDRAAYERVVRETRAQWPADSVAAEFGDNVPSRMPAWTGIAPPFGCVGGVSSVGITAAGTVSGCDGLTDAADWSLRQHSLAECWRGAPSVLRWRALEPNPRCRACPLLPRCGGGCRLRALAAEGDLAAPDPWAACPPAGASVVEQQPGDLDSSGRESLLLQPDTAG